MSIIHILLRIGLVTRRYDGTIRWPLSIGPWWMWKWFLTRPVSFFKFWTSPCIGGCGGVYLFRNLPGVIKWREGRLLPVRWGFGIFGLIEFGDRG